MKACKSDKCPHTLIFPRTGAGIRFASRDQAPFNQGGGLTTEGGKEGRREGGREGGREEERDESMTTERHWIGH